MKYKPGDKVWVKQGRIKPACGFPILSPQPGVVLGLNEPYSAHHGLFVYDVDVPGFQNPKDGTTRWTATEGTLTPRDDPQTFDEPDLSTANPDKVSVWGAGGTWLPEGIKASYLKWFTQLR